MSSNHGYGQGKKREMLRKWDENNIFGDEYVDMFGISMDKNNIESVHHIFDRNMQCVGVACLSRYIHDYLDFILKLYDEEEYYTWNEYLRDVYEYITNNVRMISLYELKTIRYELLNTLKTNQKDKFEGKTKLKYCKIKGKLKPYLKEYDDKMGNVPIISDYRIILKDNLLVDTYNAVEKYKEKCEFDELVNKCKNNKDSSLQEVKLHKCKKLSKMISKKCNTDAMGLNLGYMTDEDKDVQKLFGTDVFLYDRSMEILSFVMENDLELFNEWISLFSSYGADDYEKKSSVLREKTYLLLRDNKDKRNAKQAIGMVRLRKSIARDNYISRQA